MNKKELINHLADMAGVNSRSAEALLGALTATIISTVKSGGELAIPDIGKFGVKDVAARTGHNPKTGEAIQIAAKRAPKFTMAKALKDAAAKS
ncbi:MAG: DNA-binding protein HU-beta [Pseudomonadota bacterium]|jgi:DNA-binding protein HU-beta